MPEQIIKAQLSPAQMRVVQPQMVAAKPRNMVYPGSVGSSAERLPQIFDSDGLPVFFNPFRCNPFRELS